MADKDNLIEVGVAQIDITPITQFGLTVMEADARNPKELSSGFGRKHSLSVVTTMVLWSW